MGIRPARCLERSVKLLCPNPWLSVLFHALSLQFLFATQLPWWAAQDLSSSGWETRNVHLKRAELECVGDYWRKHEKHMWTMDCSLYVQDGVTLNSLVSCCGRAEAWQEAWHRYEPMSLANVDSSLLQGSQRLILLLALSNLVRNSCSPLAGPMHIQLLRDPASPQGQDSYTWSHANAKLLRFWCSVKLHQVNLDCGYDNIYI